MTKDGVTASYVYNADGIRTQKTVDGVVHDYILDGTRILADYSSGSELIFAYDEKNTPQSFTYNGTKYNYFTNLQGDVIEIRDSANNIVGSYVYNAYGEIISKSGAMADINPLRYRGYYYDTETGFYYLNSRYYDPDIGRFINADSLIDTNNFQGYNLFTYCNNNPINMTDNDGQWPSWATKIIVGVAVISVAAAVTVVTGGAGAGVAGYIAAGVLKGAIIGAATGAAIGAGTGAISHRLSTGSWKGSVKATLIGFADGFMAGAITGAITGGAGRATQVLRNTKVTVRSLPKTSNPMSSQSLIKNGKVGQTRYYGMKGKAKWDIDFTNHSNPLKHSNPHAHSWNFSRSPFRSGPLNGFRWW